VRQLRFVPEHAIAGIPNVVVDGSANADTVLTLSHWPGAPTPPELRDDLSAQIAFHALDRPELFDGIDVVTNNHFDQDGLVSVFALVEPAAALARRDLLIDVASAGDFGTFTSRTAARVAIAIAALDDDQLSPLPADALAGPYPQRCGALYEWALPRLLDMVDHPDDWLALWEDEDAHLGESLDAIAFGAVPLTEYPEVDLAVLDVPDEWVRRASHRFTIGAREAVHPMAVNNSTSCLRVAVLQGRRYRVELRYESWVMLTSRPVLPRPDLRLLAAELTAAEPGDAVWRADAPGTLTPTLRLVDDRESGIAAHDFVQRVQDFLATAPAAWDPFHPT
jgi:hypothetical protein